jgi:hypothetical protein
MKKKGALQVWIVPVAQEPTNKTNVTAPYVRIPLLTTIIENITKEIRRP